MNDNIKNTLRTFRQDLPLNTSNKDLKLYNEKVVQLYVNISSELNSSKYWNDFKDIQEIQYNTSNNSYLGSFHDITIKDYCKGKIDANVNNILEAINEVRNITDLSFKELKNINAFEIKYKKDSNTDLNFDEWLKEGTKNRNNETINEGPAYAALGKSFSGLVSNDIKPGSDKFHQIVKLNDSLSKDIVNGCMDFADNYIDISNNSFVGGSRTLKFKKFTYEQMEKIQQYFNSDKPLQSLTNELAFKVKSTENTNGSSSSSDRLSAGEVEKEEIDEEEQKEKLSNLFYNVMFDNTENFKDLDSLHKYDKYIYERNINKPKSNSFHHLYKCILMRM